MVIENSHLISLDTTDPKWLFIPDGVTSIGARAAYGRNTLLSIHISSDTRTIGSQSFAECLNLKDVTIQDGVKRLGEGCFQGCTSLRKIKLPDTVVSIHSCAFKKCTSLADVYLSCNLSRNLESETFADCTALKSIVIPFSVRQIKPEAFAHCKSLCHIIFQNPDVIIAQNAFCDCPSLPDTALAFIEEHFWKQDTVDISSRASGPAGRLSNYTERHFVLDGVQCHSIEGVLQSLKTDDTEAQKQICLLTGGWASKAGKAFDWQSSQRLYWQGVSFERRSEAYARLLTHIYDTVFMQDSGFRADLAALKGRNIDHRMGLSNPSETVLTRFEFLQQLRRLMEKTENESEQSIS